MGFADILFSLGEELLRELDNKKTGGKIFDKIDSKIAQNKKKYYRKMNDINKIKSRLNNLPDEKLIEICKNENETITRRQLAMQLLKERGKI